MLALGSYLLARGRELSAPLANMVGLIAALNGWIICWGATDWFGALGAFAWLPWAWWGLERALDPRRGRYRFLWPAPFVYLLITGGFPYTVVMLALLAAWLSLRSIVRTRSLVSLWPLALGVLLGTGLSAPAWLALIEYLGGSARQNQESAAHFQWLVPASAWPGLIFPGWTVNWSDFSTRLVPHSAAEMACGLVAPAALLFALVSRDRSFVRQFRWELGLLLLLLLLSMVPTANVFRWSFRWLPFVHLVLALCAADALRMSGTDRRLGPFAFGSIAGVGAVMYLLGAAGPSSLPLLLVLLALAAVWSFAGTRAWLPPALTYVSLLAIYFYIPPHSGTPRYNLDPRLTSAAPLDPQRLYLSVYPAAEFAYRSEAHPGPLGTVVRPGSTSMWGGVRLINGYSPIRPAGVARTFDAAIHGEVAPWAGDYFPAYKGGPDDVLAQIGVDGIIVASELTVVPKPDSEWELVHSSPEGRVYHRRGPPFPRVRANDGSVIRVLEDSRQRVVTEIESRPGNAPTQLAFSRPYFPGYRAHLGGRALEVGAQAEMIPTVELPAGATGRLVLEYRPWWLVAGGAVAGACALFSLGALVAATRAQ